MKRTVLAALSISALASVNALAADLPQRPVYKTPMAAPAPVYNWTGCYVGANIGGAWGNINATDVTTGATVSPRNSGFAGGGQVGCDYQMSQWVFGVRNIFDATSISNGATISDALISGTVNSHLRWFDALTARAGYLVQPNVLLYGQGGAAWTSWKCHCFQYGRRASRRNLGRQPDRLDSWRRC